jgi:PAS domain S-box-containing protein
VTSYLRLSRSGSDEIGCLLDRIVLSSSACLAKCPAHAIDNVIVSTLRELCRAEGADHAGWFLLQKTSRGIEHLDSVSTAKIFDQKSSFDSCKLPWCASSLLRGDSVVLNSLAELREDAEMDRSYLDGFGVRSLALLPIDCGETNLGVLALVSVKQLGCWSSNLAQQCVLLGSAFLSARSRKLMSMTSNSNFREAFQSASVGMALEDISGGLIYVNEALCAMLGYSEAELVRMSCVDFSHPGDLEREAVLFNQLFKGERQSYEIEKRFLNRSGITVWGKVSVTLLKKPADQTPLVLGIVEDITAQKFAIERLARSQLEVQTLASRIMLSQEDERRTIARKIHDDIGQRLSLVASEIHSLHSGPETGHQITARTLEHLSEKLDALVTDLHDLSHRLHSSKLQHLGLEFALRDVCRRFERAGLSVDFEYDEALETPPENIAVCLIRTAEEALSNVLKHSGAGEAELSLSQRIDGYSLSIRDTGQGFSTHARSNGLGLIGIRERVRTLHGRMIIRSRRGEGTQVTVWLPLQPSAN